MSNSGNNVARQSDEAVERLLQQAPPRPTPPAEIKAEAKFAVEAEWRRLTQRRRRHWRLAVAASVLVLATAMMTLLSVPDAVPVQVATIDKANGTVSLLREHGILEDAGHLQAVESGQTIVTDSASGLGLSWGNGGSLRLDANTTVRFVDGEQIELHAGRVYFDSNSDELSKEAFLIHTDYGDVRHLGTQYMTEVGKTDLLKVSVREGKVSIDGLFHDTNADVGQQVVLHGNRAPQIASLATYSQEWRWVEAMAPAASMDGKTFEQLLDWVSRETGLNYEFETAAAEAIAQKILSGVGGSEPLSVLSVGARSLDLVYQRVDGVIRISQTES